MARPGKLSHGVNLLLPNTIFCVLEREKKGPKSMGIGKAPGKSELA